MWICPCLVAKSGVLLQVFKVAQWDLVSDVMICCIIVSWLSCAGQFIRDEALDWQWIPGKARDPLIGLQSHRLALLGPFNTLRRSL